MASGPVVSGDSQNVNENKSTDNPEQQYMFDDSPTPPKTEPAKLIRRVDWGAKPPKWIDTLTTPVKKVVLTWTETEGCYTEEECKQRVRDIQEEHMKDKDVPDIKHNFLVGGDGGLYEGRGYTRVGPKYPLSLRNIEELTGESIEIAFIQKHVKPLSPPMIDSATHCVALHGRHHFEDNFNFIWIHPKTKFILNKVPVALKK